MDNGLILLNTIEASYYVGNKWYFTGSTMAWIMTGIAVAFITIGILSFLVSNYDESAIPTGIVLIVTGIIFLGGTFNHDVYKNYPQYQVTITEQTNMKEFYEKYELINQEGLIFTIRDKDYKERDYS